MLFMAVNFKNINPIIRKYIILFTYLYLKKIYTIYLFISTPTTPKIEGNSSTYLVTKLGK